MSDNLLQRSVTTAVARNLANTTKTSPKMMSITPRWLLSLLPWVQVNGGTYRVNRTKIELPRAERIAVEVSDKPSDVTVRTLTPCVLLAISRKDLDAVLKELPNFTDDFRRAIAEHEELRSSVNKFGERNIDLVSGFAENVEIPETFVDYSASPREYSLSSVQTVVRVHTRVSDRHETVEEDRLCAARADVSDRENARPQADLHLGARRGHRLPAAVSRTDHARDETGRFIRHFDGILAPIGCVSSTHYESCSLESRCRFRRILLDIRNDITSTLDDLTLAQAFRNSPVGREELFSPEFINGDGI